MKIQFTLMTMLLVTINNTRCLYSPNHQLFENKKILITGGTGYLGRTLAEEILKYSPKQITILSRDEVKHFQSRNRFKNNPILKNVIADVRDYNALLRHTENIDLVIHTAALKRMDSLEDNVLESIKTNIMGSFNLFNACVDNKVKKVIFISTDKACSPINIYGSCKFVSEKIFTNYDYKNISTQFSTVRFGNILDSTGSVIPIFTEKIIKGEPITLTDPQMTRFIISKDEAVEFIFDAIRYGIGGEIFTKELPSLKVSDLIDVLKEKHHATNTIEIIGLRPGEKMHETLINEFEMSRTYQFRHMKVITPSLGSWLEYAQSKSAKYIHEGRLIQCKQQDYSSDKAVISKSDLGVIIDHLFFTTTKKSAALIEESSNNLDWFY